MEYTINARPTIYNGIQFRSRLEATWAAFFDLNGWGWKYEPIELKGWTGLLWTPDFIIKPNPESDDVLVEVKPLQSPEGFKDSSAWKWVMAGEDVALLFLGLDVDSIYWGISLRSLGAMLPQMMTSWKESWKKAHNMTQWRPRA